MKTNIMFFLIIMIIIFSGITFSQSSFSKPNIKRNIKKENAILPICNSIPVCKDSVKNMLFRENSSSNITSEKIVSKENINGNVKKIKRYTKK